MNMILKGFKLSLCFLGALIIASCTSASVEQDLIPQPIATEQTNLQTNQVAQAGQQVAGQVANPTALAPQPTPIPSQNVVEAQLTQQATQQVQSTVQPVTPAALTQVASLDTSKAVSFLPFEGAPQSKASSFNKFLNSSAKSNGLTVLPSTRTGAKYKVKGYFSALNDGTGTLLVYVWDVTDNSGKRLHRINGRERSGTSKTDPWQAITDAEIQRVASTTTARLKSWVDKRK